MLTKQPFIFLSCGQSTDAERELGTRVAESVRSITGADVFYAQEVRDLNGLDANILNALKNCSALIAIIHPRGIISRPDGSRIIRASVWIEQEIAIATYIQRTDNRPMPVIAFIHRSVGREGLRDLIHLNPTEFSEDAEVFDALPARLRLLGKLTPRGVSVFLGSENRRRQEEHNIRTLVVRMRNDTNQRISDVDCLIQLPAGILAHWSTSYSAEVKSELPGQRWFRPHPGAIPPRSGVELFRIDYCSACAARHDGLSGDIASAIVGGKEILATVWISNIEHRAVRTVAELSEDP